MLLGLFGKKAKVVAVLPRLEAFKLINLYSTSAPLGSIRVPKNVEYVPGVQGYAPGFGPPSLKPKKTKKKSNRTREPQKSSSVTSSADASSSGTSLGGTISSGVNLLAKKVEQSTSAENSTASSLDTKDSVSFVQKKINPLEISYTKKMSLLRQHYRAELQGLETKRKMEAKIEAEKMEAEELKEKELQDKLVQEIKNKHLEDQLTFDKVLSDDIAPADGAVFADGETQVNTSDVNPFTDPVRKAARVSAKRENFNKATEEQATSRKTALLKLYYGASDYITPQNIDARLDHIISSPQDPKKILGDALRANNTLKYDEKIKMLEGALEGTINGQLGVEQISNHRPRDSVLSDFISDAVFFQEKPSSLSNEKQ